MSNLDDILNAIVADHQAAALTIGGNALTIVKRKLPKKEETVDQPYQVTISAAEHSEDVIPIAAGKYVVKYYVEMTLVTPNDHDALQNLVDHETWREATRGRYMVPTPLPAVPAVRRIEINKAPFLDRHLLAEGYDYDQIAIILWTYGTQ